MIILSTSYGRIRNPMNKLSGERPLIVLGKKRATNPALKISRCLRAKPEFEKFSRGVASAQNNQGSESDNFFITYYREVV
jgi:hypothetical protein